MSLRLRVSFVALILASLALLIALLFELGQSRLNLEPLATGQILHERARVSAVIDGTTVRLQSGEVIHYFGVELPAEEVGAQRVAAAAEANRALVEGREVVLKRVSGADGRAYLFRDDGTFIQAELVRGGYLSVDSGEPGEYQQALLVLEDEARRAGLGLWHGLSTSPTPTSLVLSQETLANRPREETAVPFVCGPRVVAVEGALDVTEAEARRIAPRVTVVFQVVSVTAAGTDVILNSAYPAEGHFRVVIPATLHDAFAGSPLAIFAGRCVAVSGRLQPYRATTQIVVRDPDDLFVVR